jgi:competence protein ComEA
MALDDFKGLLEKTEEQSSQRYNNKQLIGIILMVILLVSGAFMYYLQSKPVVVRQDVFDAEKEKPVAAKQESGSKKSLIVHVCGAVNRPGVLKLKDGDRIVDAIECAGGANGEADLEVLNLAAKVIDGSRVYVPKQGEQISGAAINMTSQNGPSQTEKPPPVNINNANADQLEALPGVGEVLAQRIMEYREDKGGFSSIEQLRNIEGIGPKKFEQLKDKVTVD